MDALDEALGGVLLLAAIEQPEQDDPEVAQVAEVGQGTLESRSGRIRGVHHRALECLHHPHST